jgi:hypothetical protein
MSDWNESLGKLEGCAEREWRLAAPQWLIYVEDESLP